MEVARSDRQYAALREGADGLWHIVSQFTTAKEGTEHVMSDVVNYGYSAVSLGER